MKARTLIFILVVGVAVMYVLEQYVLMGQVLVNGTANISDMNPRPSVAIPVREAGTTVRVYLKADDISVTYTVLDPQEAIVVEHMVALGRHDFSFDAPERGSYVLVLESESDQGQVTMSAWGNDKRLLYGLYF